MSIQEPIETGRCYGHDDEVDWGDYSAHYPAEMMQKMRAKRLMGPGGAVPHEHMSLSVMEIDFGAHYPPHRHEAPRDCTVAQVWAQEQPQLMALPPPFDGFVEHTKRVSPTCLINFERDRYSVPSPLANRPVSLRVYAEHWVVVAEGEVIAQHERLLAQSHDHPGRTVYGRGARARQRGCVQAAHPERAGPFA